MKPYRSIRWSGIFARLSLGVLAVCLLVLVIGLFHLGGLHERLVAQNQQHVHWHQNLGGLLNSSREAYVQAVLALERNDHGGLITANARIIDAMLDADRLPGLSNDEKETLAEGLEALAASVGEIRALMARLPDSVPDGLHELLTRKMAELEDRFTRVQGALHDRIDADAGTLSGRLSSRWLYIIVLTLPMLWLTFVMGRCYARRERSVEALRMSEEHYRLLAENATDYIWTRDLDFRLTYASPAVQWQQGYTVEEAMRLMPRDILTQESYELIMRVFREEMEAEKLGDADPHRTRTIQTQQRRKDGSLFWAESRLRFLRDADGRPVGLLGVTRDITQRKEAEDRLRMLSHAVEQSPASIVVTDLSGKIEYVNPKFCELTGYRYEECLGKNPRLLKSGLTPPEAYDNFWRTIGAGGTWQGEFSNRRKDGSLYWEFVTASSMKDASGAITHYIAVKEDITRRKEAEERLKRSEELFRSIINLTDEGFWLSDAEFRALDVNDSLCRMLGYDRGEMIGKTPFDFVDEENLKIFKEQTAKAADVPNRTYEIALRAKDGTNVNTIIHATTKMDDAGRPENIFAFITDVGKLKRMEHELRESLDEKEMLMREVHHRTKNNLVVIQSLLYLQSRRLEGAESRSALQASTDRVRAMSIIHDKLYRARDLKSIGIKKYLGELITQLFSSYRLNPHVRLTMEIADIPMDVDTVIPCGLIVNELVTNALKYAFPGDRTGEVGIFLHFYDDERFVLRVRDDGAGLPEGFRPKDVPSLGMKIVDTLVGQLRGRLDIDSGPGGTEFKVTFKERTVV